MSSFAMLQTLLVFATRCTDILQ